MIFRDVFWHWVYNVISFSVPLLLIPHLIGAFGVAQYGAVAMVQIVSFATLPLIDFGLSTIGPRWIADAELKFKLPQTVKIATSAHFIAWTIASLLGYIYVEVFLPDMVNAFIFSQLAALLTVLPPLYIVVQAGFQKQYGIWGAVSKLILVGFVISTVRQKSDVDLYFFIQFASALVPVIAMQYIFFKKKYSLLDFLSAPLNFNEVLSFLYSGLPQLIRRTAAIPIVIVLPAVLLSFHGQAAVAVYSVVDKIRTITWQAVNPILSSYASHFFQKRASVDEINRSYEFKVSFLLIFISLSIIIPSFLFTEYILSFLKVPTSVDNILAWRIGSVGSIPGVLLAYLTTKYVPLMSGGKVITYLYWLFSFLICGSAVFLVDKWGVIYAVTQMMLWEFSAAAIILYFYKKKMFTV